MKIQIMAYDLSGKWFAYADKVIDTKKFPIDSEEFNQEIVKKMRLAKKAYLVVQTMNHEMVSKIILPD